MGEYIWNNCNPKRSACHSHWTNCVVHSNYPYLVAIYIIIYIYIYIYTYMLYSSVTL